MLWGSSTARLRRSRAETRRGAARPSHAPGRSDTSVRRTCGRLCPGVKRSVNGSASVGIGGGAGATRVRRATIAVASGNALRLEHRLDRLRHPGERFELLEVENLLGVRGELLDGRRLARVESDALALEEAQAH